MGADAAVAPETVVLLHGLARTDRSMRPLEKRLTDAGFQVHNLGYPSTERTPEELVANLHAQISACCAAVPRLHFVTHSLGGILLRAYLADHPHGNLGRVVMLAPPNHGSELADLLSDSRLFELAFGPTATQLGTAPDSLPNRLPPPTFEFGVIAGTRSVNPISGLVLPGQNDGTVSVTSAGLSGMSDFVAVPVSHPLIMQSEVVGRHVIEFLQHGRFRPPDP
jgi:triacylglycerol esterase/lipase EstA (alpha/beta hydrolase family)